MRGARLALGALAITGLGVGCGPGRECASSNSDCMVADPETSAAYEWDDPGADTAGNPCEAVEPCEGCNGIETCGECASAGWSSAGLLLCIGFGTQEYSLGMAETGSTDGWYGEDCLEGDFTGYDLCHYDVQPWGIQLDTVTSPDDVVMNRTTLLTDTTANAGTITYLLFGNSDGSCWTWGNDPSYYAELGCEEW